MQHGAYGEHPAVVAHDGLHHLGCRGARSVPGGRAHQFNQLSAAHFRALDDGVQRVVVNQFRNGDTADRGVAGKRNHRVAVAAQQQGLDVFRRNVQRLGQEGAVTGGVQDAGHAEHAVGIHLGGQVSAVAHHVQRVGHDDNLGVGRVLDDVLGHGLHDAGVGGDKVVAAHARFAGKAGGDDHHLGVVRGLVVVGHALDAGVVEIDGGCLPHVQRLALGHAFFDVQKNDFVHDVFFSDAIGACRTNVSCSYNCYFHLGNVFIVIRICCVINHSFYTRSNVRLIFYIANLSGIK